MVNSDGSQRELRTDVQTCMIGILTHVFQGNKLASGILFAVLLNFKHIYMYLAVTLIYPFSLSDVALTCTVFPACIFCLSASFFLHVTVWATRN
jgi:ALG6, ALG8 glycosyltransferase family